MSSKVKAKKGKKKKVAKAAAEPRGKKVLRAVMLPLSDKSKVERGELAHQKLADVDRLEAEKAKVAKEYKEEIGACRTEARKLLDEFSSGQEKREVMVTEVRNFGRNIVEYWYHGRLVETRELTLADKQDELPLKGGKVKEKAASEAAAPPAPSNVTSLRTRDVTPKRGIGEDPPAVDGDQEIAAARREESSARKKWSATDGARPEHQAPETTEAPLA